MPIYEYECPNCGNIKKIIRNISERDNDIDCEECSVMTRGGNILYHNMERIPSTFEVKWNCPGGYQGK